MDKRRTQCPLECLSQHQRPRGYLYTIMTKTEAKKLNRGDRIKVTLLDVTFLADVVAKDDNALSFMEHLNDCDDQFRSKRVGIIELK